MSAVEVFEFEDRRVRTVILEGEPWFVARDVASLLGYADTVNAIKLHCKGVAKYHPLATAGGEQEARVISEPDMLRLIVSSKLPSAERFERWIFEEVLPQIRRTGSYNSQPALTDEQIVHRALTITAAKVKQLEAKISEDAPKVLFADSVAASDTTILVGDLAKVLRGNGVQVGGTRLFAWLRRDGFLLSRGGAWNMPSQRSMELGLFRVKETAVTHSDGHVTVKRTPKVTGRGQQYFVNRYARGVAA